MRTAQLTEQQFKRPQELARALQVGTSTVLEWCREGRIATVRAGKLYRIPAGEYQRILREGVRREIEPSPLPTPSPAPQAVKATRRRRVEAK